MKFIRLTSIKDSKPVFINPDFIGHMYQVPEKMSYGRVDEEAHTVVGVTTHNNGGFRVAEDVEQILKQILHPLELSEFKSYINALDN
jgi:hypothetical protein